MSSLDVIDGPCDDGLVDGGQPPTGSQQQTTVTNIIDVARNPPAVIENTLDGIIREQRHSMCTGPHHAEVNIFPGLLKIERLQTIPSLYPLVQRLKNVDFQFVEKGQIGKEKQADGKKALNVEVGEKSEFIQG